MKGVGKLGNRFVTLQTPILSFIIVRYPCFKYIKPVYEYNDNVTTRGTGFCSLQSDMLEEVDQRGKKW